MKSSFFIVADRGNLKAFRVEKVPTDHPPRMQLVQAFSFVDAHMKVSEINTDLAGGYPAGGGAPNGKGGGMRHQNSIAEKHYSIEFDRRSAKQLAETIAELLKQEQPGTWSFAAPAEIREAVLGQLSPELRKSLAECIARDLVNVPPGELLEHFTAVKAA